MPPEASDPSRTSVSGFSSSVAGSTFTRLPTKLSEEAFLPEETRGCSAWGRILVPCLLVNCGIFRGSQGGLPGALNLGQHGRALGAPHVAFGLQVVTSQVLMERIDQLRDAAETAGQNRLLA